MASMLPLLPDRPKGWHQSLRGCFTGDLPYLKKKENQNLLQEEAPRKRATECRIVVTRNETMLGNFRAYSEQLRRVTVVSYAAGFLDITQPIPQGENLEANANENSFEIWVQSSKLSIWETFPDRLLFFGHEMGTNLGPGCSLILSLRQHWLQLHANDSTYHWWREMTIAEEGCELTTHFKKNNCLF